MASKLNRDAAIPKALVKVLLDRDLRRRLRDQLADLLRPLDQAHAVPVEVLLVADLVHLIGILDAVHIKMIQRNPALAVLLNDRKRRAADRLGHAESLRNALGKYCLADTQIPV